MILKITNLCQAIHKDSSSFLLHSTPCTGFTDSHPKPRAAVSSPTEAAGKCFEFDKMVHVVVQEPEGPLSEDLRVRPAGPWRDQLEQACKLPAVYAVLLGVGTAGVVAGRPGPRLLPVAAHHVLPLKAEGPGPLTTAGGIPCLVKSLLLNTQHCNTWKN